MKSADAKRLIDELQSLREEVSRLRIAVAPRPVYVPYSPWYVPQPSYVPWWNNGTVTITGNNAVSTSGYAQSTTVEHSGAVQGSFTPTCGYGPALSGTLTTT